MTKALKHNVIKQLKEPTPNGVEKDIEWICKSLGFSLGGEKDKTAYIILKSLIEEAEKGKGLTSQELANKVNPTQAAVIYHLKKLMKAGLIVKLNSEYELRMNSLQATIREIEKDVHSTFENMQRIASQIDVKIGLETR